MPNVTEQGNIVAKIILNDQEFMLKLDNITKQTRATANQISRAWVRETTKMAQKSSQDFGKIAKTKAAKDKDMVDSNAKAARMHNDIADKASKSVLDHWISRFGKIAIGFTIWYRAINALENLLGKLKDEVIDTIRVIDDFNKETLGAAAAVASFAKTDDPFTTYSKVLPIVRQQMNELEIVAARHLVTAEELRLAYASFIKKGVFAVTDEDIRNLATMSDAIKLFAREAGGVQQIQQEIFSLMEGQRGKGRELVYVFQAMYPELRKQIEAWKAMGKDIDGNNILLQQLANSVAGLKAAQEDIYKLYQTQITSLKTYWNYIKRIGGETTYERISESLKEINESLINSEGPSELMISLAEEWHILLSSIYRILKSIATYFEAAGPILVGLNRMLEGLSYIAIITSGILKTLEAIGDNFIVKFITIGEADFSNIYDLEAFLKGVGKSGSEAVKALKELVSGDLDEAVENTSEAFRELKKALGESISIDAGTKKKIVDIWSDVEQDLLSKFKNIKSEIDKSLFPDPKESEETLRNALEESFKHLNKYYTLRNQLAKKAGYDAVEIARFEAESFRILTKAKIDSMKLEEDERKVLLKLYEEANVQIQKDIVTLARKQMLKRDTTFYKERLNLVKGFSYDFRILEKADLDIFIYAKQQQWQILEDERVITKARHQQLLDDLERYYKERTKIINQNERNRLVEQEIAFNELRTSYMKEAGYSRKDLLIEDAKLYKKTEEQKIQVLLDTHKIELNKWEELYDKIQEVYYKKILVAEGSLKDGMREGWEKFFEDLGTTFEKGEAFMSDFAEGMRNGLKSGFFDLAKGDIENFGDFFEAMLDNMLNAVTDYVSKIAIELAFGDIFKQVKGSRASGAGIFGGFLSTLFGGFGGATIPGHLGGLTTAPTIGHGVGFATMHTGGIVPKRYHSGGTIVSNLPRAHGGMFVGDLKPREVPIIAEEGETVLPKSDKSASAPLIVNIMANDAQSFYRMTRENPKAIIDPFLRAIDSGDKQIISKLRSVL